MEPNFQTSFIPKKPMIEERASVPRPIGLLVFISVLVFFTVILSSAGLFFYKGVMQKKIAGMVKDLNEAKDRFEPSLIVKLQTLDRRLQASTEVLDSHIAITPIFSALQAITMKSVRYTRFSYELGTPADPLVKVKLSGLAVGYRSVALQSDLFTENKNLIDPVFSNLLLDNTGNVTFDLDFSVDPNFVDYKQVIKIADEVELPPPSSTDELQPVPIN